MDGEPASTVEATNTTEYMNLVDAGHIWSDQWYASYVVYLLVLYINVYDIKYRLLYIMYILIS